MLKPFIAGVALLVLLQLLAKLWRHRKSDSAEPEAHAHAAVGGTCCRIAGCDGRTYLTTKKWCSTQTVLCRSRSLFTGPGTCPW
jgi:hypothetical protein